MKKIVYILRGIPGSGKSLLAEQLTTSIGKYISTAVCTADDYFMHDGEYKYVPENIGTAHEWCKCNFEENILGGTDIIVVANTAVREKDVKCYRDIAIEHGYNVFVLTVENWHEGKDSHTVPEETLEKMTNTLRQTIKLR